jgi:hypothetical protein
MNMNNPINEAYLDDTIKLFRQEQSAISNKQVFNMTDGQKDDDNKYIKLLCSVIESLLKIKSFKEPKPEKPEAKKKNGNHKPVNPIPPVNPNLNISFSH